jgi:hypothetical protein
MHIHQYMYELPIDENSISVWLINMRNFMLEDDHDERIMSRNEYVAFQDRDVLLDVRPRLTPPSNNFEHLMPADLCIGKYREKLAVWETRGWRIDVEEVRRNEHRAAYAIPSPARREKKGWVLDPIPLIGS